MQNNLLKETMKIPPNERVALAEMILASIDNEDKDINNAWISEVQMRMKSVKDGKSELLDFNQLYAED